jgi:hypothetical protein
METNPIARTREANASRKNILTDLNPNRKAATKGGSMISDCEFRISELSLAPIRDSQSPIHNSIHHAPDFC